MADLGDAFDPVEGVRWEAAACVPLEQVQLVPLEGFYAVGLPQ